MLKILFALFASSVFFFAQNISAQAQSKTPDVETDGEAAFYAKDMLKSDFNQVSVVLYVNVKSRELADQMGAGGCQQDKGAGYCLYLLKGEVIEVYKGKIAKKNFEFYTVTDADYEDKDRLLGEKIVFLNRSSNYPNKKMGLGTLENSTRSIKYDVVAKMRRIAKTKSNKKN